jgi:hypothetical protein
MFAAEAIVVQLWTREDVLDTRRGDYQGPSMGICRSRLELGGWYVFSPVQYLLVQADAQLWGSLCTS